MVKSGDKDTKNREKRRRGKLEGKVSDLLRNRRRRKCRIRREMEEDERNSSDDGRSRMKRKRRLGSERDMLIANIDQRKSPILWMTAFH
jgi:hypothetical protein